MIIYAVNCAAGELQVYDSLYWTVSEDFKELVDTHVYDRNANHHAPTVKQCTTKSVFFCCYFNEITISLIY